MFLFSVFRPHRVGSSLKYPQLSAVQGDNVDGDDVMVLILIVVMIVMMVVMLVVVGILLVLGHNGSGSDTDMRLIICDDDHMNPFEFISSARQGLLLPGLDPGSDWSCKCGRTMKADEVLF